MKSEKIYPRLKCQTKIILQFFSAWVDIEKELSKPEKVIKSRYDSLLYFAKQSSKLKNLKVFIIKAFYFTFFVQLIVMTKYIMPFCHDH